MDFTLEPNGRAFAEMVAVVLEREKGWVKWKNETCPSIEKQAWFQEIEEESREGGERKKRKIGLEEATTGLRRKLREPPAEWEWRLGSAPLTEIWDMGYRDLSDLENPFRPGDVKDFAKKIQQEDARIALREKQLSKQAEARKARAAPAPAPGREPEAAPVQVSGSMTEVMTNSAASALHPSLPAKPPIPAVTATSVTPTVAAPTPTPALAAAAQSRPQASTATTPTVPATPTDDQIIKYEENKHRWSWLALRTARDQYLQHFGKIGTGNVDMLLKEIEKEKLAPTEKEKDRQGQKDRSGEGSTSPMGEIRPLPELKKEELEDMREVEMEARKMEETDGSGDAKMIL